MNNNVYIPSDILSQTNCFVVSNNTIRAYIDRYNYYDIYPNNNYLIQKFTSQYGYNYTCDTLNTYTDNFYYRNDFDKILVMFFIMSIFIFYIPCKIVSKFFRRGAL